MIVIENQDIIKNEYEIKVFNYLYTQINILILKIKKKELIKLLRTDIKKLLYNINIIYNFYKKNKKLFLQY